VILSHVSVSQAFFTPAWREKRWISHNPCHEVRGEERKRKASWKRL
jgi:hypothetical protein